VLGHTDAGVTSRVYVHLFDKWAEADRSKQALGVAFQGVL
jgi:integrase